MSAATVSHWTASDGIDLAYHELGEGRPVILLHGLFSDANMNWIRFGHAERIAALRTGSGAQTPVLAPISRAQRSGPLPLSLAQRRLWFL